jgi:hypothetical protein
MLGLERVPGVLKGGAKGSNGTPGTPSVISPVLEEGCPSLVDCMVAVWWLYGGCMVVLKVRPLELSALAPA